MSSHDRGIAQLVEHRSPKPGVVSSNLTAPANKKATFLGGFFIGNRGGWVRTHEVSEFDKEDVSDIFYFYKKLKYHLISTGWLG